MTMPPKVTKALAILYFVLAYVIHEPTLAPVLGVHPRVYGAISAVLVLLGMIGISGPALAPKVAAALGNPGAKVGLLALLLFGTSCARVTSVLKACGPELINDVASVLVCDLANQAPLPDCVVAGLTSLSRNCDVTPLVKDVAANSERHARFDMVEAEKATRAKAWLASHP